MDTLSTSDNTPSSAVFVTTSSHDLDHYRAQPGNWNVQADQLSRGTFYSQIRSLQYEDLIVYDNRWGAASMIRGESPSGWIMFGGIIRPERAPVSWCGQVADDRLFACTPERQAIEFTLENGAHDIVILVKPELLAKVVGDAALDRILRAGLIDFQHQGPRLLQVSLRNLVRLEQSPDHISNSIIAADIRSEILSSLELGFRPMSSIDEWTLPRNRREESVREALSLVWRSAGRCSAWDMARAARVSQRTLEIAFRDTTGVTPGKYLKLFRLNQAHQRFKTRTMENTNVTDVALSMGFSHPGRFAADYRRLFGELPSDTLHS